MKRLVSVLLVMITVLCFCSCSKNEISHSDTADEQPVTDETLSSGTVNEQSTPTVTNFTSRYHVSSVVEKDGRVYFASDDAIYSQLFDGSDTQPVVYANKPNRLSFYGDKLYYTVLLEDGSHKLCVYENGTPTTVFEDGRSGISDYQIVEDKLWILVELSLYCMDLTTGNVTDMELHINEFHIIDDVLYYIEHAQRTFTIYKKDIKSGKTDIVKGSGVSLPEKELYSDFAIVGDKMYYLKRVPYGLFTDDGQGGDVLVTERDVESIKCIDDKLMYVADDDGVANLYSFDGETERKIATLGDYNTAFSFSCVGGKVYYSYKGECMTSPMS